MAEKSNNVAPRKHRKRVGRSIAGDSSKKGGILEALRRSPLVGANIEFGRSLESDTGRRRNNPN